MYYKCITTGCDNNTWNQHNSEKITPLELLINLDYDIYSKISKSLKDIQLTPCVSKSKIEYKDGFITTRYGHCYYNKSSNTYTNIESYLKWKNKKFDELNERDLTFISSLPKDVNHLGKPFKLHLGRYGLYLKDDNNINHKIEKKLWGSFM